MTQRDPNLEAILRRAAANAARKAMPPIPPPPFVGWGDDSDDLSTREEPEGEPLWTALGIVAGVVVLILVGIFLRGWVFA